MDPVDWFLVLYCAGWVVGGGMYIVASVLWTQWTSPLPPRPTTIHSPGRGGKRGVMKEDAKQNFEAICREMRQQSRGIETTLREMMRHPVFHEPEAHPGQHGEMRAQTMLAVRHLEDARMRIGKMMQYAGDGESTYDKLDRELP